MFTMAKLRDGSTYLANHLSANDYYSEKESVAGVWVGQGAERLGLAGRGIGAHDEAFERLRCNRHPLTGRKLTARTGAGRIAFLDFQCSAPKSVSLLAVTFGDERLRRAHHDAVTVAFAELERFAARRVRDGAAAWSEQTALTGNLCAARFEHDASRALDAQLHTHLVTANATFDAKAKKWFALTEREMVTAIRYSGKVYQNELARGVLAAGYAIESARNERGAIEGFEISGVSAEDRAIASKRRAQIETEIAAFRQRHGRPPTTRELHGITTRTRDSKLAEITTAEVRRRQRADFPVERAAGLDALVEVARHRGPITPAAAGEAAALTQARNHLFERASVQRGHDVLAEALNQNLGGLTLEDLKHSFLEGKTTDCVALRPGEHGLHAAYATREGLRQELSAIAVVNEGRDACSPLGWHNFKPDARLSDDQRAAVKSLLESTDRVCALRGVAGAGIMPHAGIYRIGSRFTCGAKLPPCGIIRTHSGLVLTASDAGPVNPPLIPECYIEALRCRPLRPHVQRYIAETEALHYRPGTIRLHVRWLIRLDHWLHRTGRGLRALDENVGERWLRRSLSHHEHRSGGRTLLRRFLALLREANAIPPPRPQRRTPGEHLADSYRQFLARERGLVDITIYHYSRHAERFLSKYFAAGRVRCARLQARDVTDFVQRHARLHSRGYALQLVNCLRSFFRFLHYRGHTGVDLSSAVPTVAHWRMSHLPKHLSAEAVQQVLARHDRATPVGRRNYAILLLLARLGLRAQEVRTLQLEDVDWTSARLTIRSKKGRGWARLPLPKDAGQAIAHYLRERPRSRCRNVFVRLTAPHTPIANSAIISNLVRAAIEHAGVEAPRTGAHVFRHSLATAMLRRGASLDEIGQVLRHKSADTTAIYAKVDLASLRRLAVALPGGAR